ncbi:MAG: flagellar protein FlaG [Clostridiales bacterium]|jgi:flagellar protein FlaG|nr:flagellar protein FlaG [Clostridiales bacterium]MDN5297956.1 flagellar protein FlaG [Clostridiales bacterium]
MKINGISTAQSMSTEAISKENRAVNPTENVRNESANISGASMMPVKIPGNEENDINEDLLQKSVDQANKNLQQYNRFIEREVHEVTHTVMYKLVDSTTNEVISEFPPKKIEDMIAKMWELAGLFVDEKA